MYEVSWCLVGKDPDSEPFLISDWKDAVKFLHDEIWYLTRDFNSSGAYSSQEQAVDAMNALSVMREAEPKDFVCVIGDISYWINVSEPLEGLWKL